MKSTLALFFLAAAVLLVSPVGSRAGSNSANVSIAARVAPFAEWADPAPVIFEADWSGAINKVNQSQTASRSLILYTNTDAIITAAPGLNGGILTSGSQVLSTAYKLTGSLTVPDSSFKAAGAGPGEFFNAQNTYTVAHQAGTGAYNVNLAVEMRSPANSAPDQGVYTCGVVLTAGW